MPVKVVAQLKEEVQMAKKENLEDSHKVELMCRMAKKKVRDADGATTAAQRAVAVEAALKFCRKTKDAVKKEEKVNTDRIDHVVRADAAKYGLKVVKIESAKAKKSAMGENVRGRMHPSKASVEAEETMFRKAIGKQANFANHKNALHEAMREAEHHALHGQIRRMKAHINQSLAGQQRKADMLCEITKKKIAALGGKKNAFKREHHLKKALQFCHQAEGVLASERAADYAALK